MRVTPSWFPRTLATACVTLWFAGGRLALAQEPSPLADVLAHAHAALDNLQYARADSIAGSVLALGTRASRAERIDALSIAAAALYPEEPRAQHKDSAATVLRRLVRLEPEQSLSSAVSWRGLDALLEQVRREAFGAIARPRRENQVLGVAAAVSVPVVATRPARFHLAAIPSGGPPIPLDSSGPTATALLHIRLFDRDRPRLPSGDYVLRLLAVDSAAPDTITLEYPTHVDAPALDLLPTLDSTQLLPERTRPHRGRSIAIGIGLGGATALLASLLRGASPLGESGSAGSGAYVVGAGLTAGVIIAGLNDHGAPIPENVAANARRRAEYARAHSDLVLENDRRRASYRASVTIEPEPIQ